VCAGVSIVSIQYNVYKCDETTDDCRAAGGRALSGRTVVVGCSMVHGQRGHIISILNWIITHTCGRHVSNDQCGNVAPSSRGGPAHATTRPRPRRSGRYRACDQRSAAVPRRACGSPIRDQPCPCDDGVLVVPPAPHRILHRTTE